MLLTQRGLTVRPRVVAERNDPDLGDSGREQRDEPTNPIVGGEGSLAMSVQPVKCNDARQYNKVVSDQCSVFSNWK